MTRALATTQDLHSANCVLSLGTSALSGTDILSLDTVLFSALKFIWNATRGHRLAPWRSEYLRWRVETYSSKPAETLRARDIFAFMWASKWELLSFLLWTGQVQKEARRRP